MPSFTERDYGLKDVLVQPFVANRAETGRARVAKHFETNLQAFLEFVLSQYVKEGVGELESKKLPDLLELKYKGLGEATAQLGQVGHIREAFVDFQRFLYQERVNA